MGISQRAKCIITNVQTSYQNILDNVSGHKHGATGIKKLLPIVNFLFYFSSVCSFEFIGVVNISAPIVILWISLSFVAFTTDRSSISTGRGSLLALLLNLFLGFVLGIFSFDFLIAVYEAWITLIYSV